MDDISLRDLVTAIRDGRLSGEQAREVLRSAASRYARPSLDLVPLGQDDFEEYLEWSDRANALAAEMRDIMSSVETLAQQSPELLKPVGDLVAEASHLIDAGLIRVLLRFGYEAWNHRDYLVAVHFLERAGNASPEEDEFLYCTALSYLVDSLLLLDNSGDASYWLDIFTQQAESQGLRGYLSLAYRDLSRLKEAQGRSDEAFAAIKSAISLRQSLTEKEIAEQSVISPADFHYTAGIIARNLGQAEDAIAAFQQAYEEHLEREDYGPAATAMSDIGFTYERIGDTDRAHEYLRRAAEFALRHGQTELAARWMAEIQPETAAPFPPAEGDVSGREAYARSVAVSAALKVRRTEGASRELEWLISWAQQHKDHNLELACRSNLANVYDIEGNLFQAVLKDRSAAHLALRMGNVPAWIQIQANVVDRYMRFGNEGLPPAGRVIRNALARIEGLLRDATSTELRQLIQAGVQRLYEGLVLLSLVAGDAEGTLRAAERARGRNTAGWIGADRLIGDLSVDESLKQRLRELLLELRAVDTATEEYMLIGPIATSRLNSLREAREQVQLAMTRTLARAPDAAAAIEQALRGEEMPWSDARQVLTNVPDSAVLYLFGIREGVAALLLRSDEVHIAGSALVRWPRDERIKVLRRWAGPLTMSPGRAAGTGEQALDGEQAADGLRLSRDLLPVKQVAADQATVLERLREEFFAHLLPLFDHRWPSNLAIVPHRELQLIPFHEFFLEVSPHTCVTVAPSLHVLVNCLLRQPTGRGSTVLVSDMTGTLPFARREVDLIRRVRAGGGVVEPSSAEELQAAMPGADLMVCAAHGIFDPVDPYRSGLVVFSSDVTAPPRLTVADVLSKVRLPDCRLVILSACESGVARQHAADEYTGLPASFLIAGAKTVIATQWPVGDDVALLMTDEFMRRWQGGSGHEPSPARALHEARVAVRAMPAAEAAERLGVRPESMAAFPFSDPARTAAFQVYGSW